MINYEIAMVTVITIPKDDNTTLDFLTQ